MNSRIRKSAAAGLSLMMVLGLAGCSGGSTASSTEASAEAETTASTEAETAVAAETETAAAAETVEAAADTQSEAETEVLVFAAASMQNALEEAAASYNEVHPNVTITINADSSGKLMTQIQEGASCDIFFSAAEKQMDTLEEAGLVVDGTRMDLVSNTLCVITYKDSGTKVTGLTTLGDASSIALADGSVPVGKYTRQAMVNAGMLEAVEDVSAITTQEISEALGGVEISEQGNVSKVLAAVEEQSCEVGTTYYSDTYNHPDIEILEQVSTDLTGAITYPIAQIVNQDADETETAAAEDFLAYLESDEAKAIYEKYQFITG